ncbi:hypothetical protein L3049_15700 [Labilibaculum sp. DW002]|uniref:START domain-containing protein n=1 Tax=Paralabilibaculum antarcticum TaxID=2912572 RepID=A0ABT5VVJ5_9BACT|nr:hypothetical protein [Labilibaculum sp. DW002]MDE5419441.1 hypothetical protein [Labilibaculum sp. DW002]
MNRIKIISSLVILLISYNVFSQGRNYKTEITKDGKATVKYETVKEKEGRHFYYSAQRNVNASLDKLDAYLSISNNHKNFLENTPISEEIRKISDNEWVTFYLFDAPWPIPDSDVIVKFNRVKKDNKLVFTAIAISDDYKKSDVYRITNYKFVYELEKVNADTTKITITADYIPAGFVPVFLINTWFPEGPARIISNLGVMK